MTDVLASLREERNPNIPELRTGDTVRVHIRIVEGDRERVQAFQGVLMRLKEGGANPTFTVRRIASHGVGVERTFPLLSPRIDKVEVLRRSRVRRARLYFLREQRGKSARLREDRSMYERKET
ncbi:MAG: 50S ribosomal protein L19 [Chloroflexota bacterium]|nr:50S ribosomal protein L19 [Chloroflexota bacterium]